jgi:hypothetical protein
VLTFGLVSRGAAAEHNKDLYDMKPVILQQDYEIAQSYKVRVAPTAVLVNVDGLIESELAVGPQAIADLLSRATVKEVAEPSASIGHMAPVIGLPSLVPAHRNYDSLTG